MASASGVQIAREIQASGRRVVLCVGEHVRMPRTYRGRDILSPELAADRALDLSDYALRHIEYFRAFLMYSVPSLRRH